ncbi:hypothetical protein DIPPA_21458 [Diplonema papillatum]|nr:hypothetical protein DIPPA_21458 [Diplonema papillatum]
MAARHGKYVREAVNRADTDRRGLAAWCRRQPRREATTLRTDRVTANVDEMDAVLQSAWDPIFRSYKEQPEPLYNLFADRFKSYIHRQPMEVEEITGADLRALLMKKSAKGACGVDGWRMAELKALPDPMLDALAELLNLVERTGEWPRALQTALVTMTPKGDDNDPVKMRPITVTSCVYRLWACRRLKDIVTWQEGWIEDGQHGFRPGHRGEDPLMTMAMEIEYALLSGDPLYGLSLDFSKCFDRVPHELTMRLMQELGLHERIMTPLRGIYGVLVRRFKLPLGVGDEFEVTNGILQGCPISVILINALLSIPMKAVKAEAPGLLTESYADDANLMTRISEAALQKGVDVVDEFCRLTGMALNMDKTFVFTTVRDYVSRLQLRSTGRKFPQATALKCLGAKLSTSRKGRDHNDTARLETATSTAHNLRHVPIPQPSRVLLVQSAILPAALARVPFAPTTKESVEKLTTGVMSAVWGTKNPKRAPEAVLGILEKAHLTDPATRMAYSITGQFYTACQRLPHLVPQAAKIREMYGPRVTAALGPVGIAVKYGLEPCGHDWAGGPLDDVKRNGEPYLPLGKSPAERNHDIRSDLKTRLRARLVARRGSYAGIADVDLDATNALWKSRACPPQTARLIRVAIAGGVNTAQHTSRMHQGGDPACTSCGNGSVEDEAHIFWRCGAYTPIRAKAEYAAIVAAEKRDWPRCLLEHGIATTRTRDLVGPVQSLMAEILAERARHVNQEWKDRKARTPWELCGQNPVRRYDFPYQRIAPAWAWLRYWDERTFLALVDWLAGLEWSSTGDVASVELAVDFELYSGLDVRLPKKEAKTLREKANGMRCMISAVMKLAAQQELGGCLPGSIKAVTTALSFIGLPSLPGLEPRPRHRMPATGGIVQEQLKGNGAYDNGPVYNDERRARAGRWPAPQRPAANPDPVHFLGAVVDKRNATKCVAHYKGKCEICRRLGDKQGPTVQACCRHHHAADDGLPIAICDRHRMSRCAVCNTPKTCCAAGHHGCREHNRGPCEGCRQLPTLAERRPAACCGKGHHSADEPKATKPAAPPNTNTPAPAATPRSPAAEQLSESPRKGRKRILQETPRPTHRSARPAATRQRTRTARYLTSSPTSPPSSPSSSPSPKTSSTGNIIPIQTTLPRTPTGEPKDAPPRRRRKRPLQESSKLASPTGKPRRSKRSRQAVNNSTLDHEMECLTSSPSSTRKQPNRPGKSAPRKRAGIELDLEMASLTTSSSSLTLPTDDVIK